MAWIGASILLEADILGLDKPKIIGYNCGVGQGGRMFILRSPAKFFSPQLLFPDLCRASSGYCARTAGESVGVLRFTRQTDWLARRARCFGGFEQADKKGVPRSVAVGLPRHCSIVFNAGWRRKTAATLSFHQLVRLADRIARGRNIENEGSESAGINRQEAEDESSSRGRSSDPLGPEFCAVGREACREA